VAAFCRRRAIGTPQNERSVPYTNSNESRGAELDDIMQPNSSCVRNDVRRCNLRNDALE
jgi:hypothetical protein